MAVRPARPVLGTRLHPANMGVAGGLVMGVAVFITTLISISTGYATAFLDLLVSVYPGYRVSAPGAFVGLVYGFIDGFISLYVLAWAYNWFETRRQRRLEQV